MYTNSFETPRLLTDNLHHGLEPALRLHLSTQTVKFRENLLRNLTSGDYSTVTRIVLQASKKCPEFALANIQVLIREGIELLRQILTEMSSEK